jgi:hypothetical protein
LRKTQTNPELSEAGSAKLSPWASIAGRHARQIKAQSSRIALMAFLSFLIAIDVIGCTTARNLCLQQQRDKAEEKEKKEDEQKEMR